MPGESTQAKSRRLCRCEPTAKTLTNAKAESKRTCCLFQEPRSYPHAGARSAGSVRRKKTRTPIRESPSYFVSVMRYSLDTGLYFARGKGPMGKPGSSTLLSVLLVFGLFLSIPPPDAPETTYDESESLPYMSTSLLFSLQLGQTITSNRTSAENAVSLRRATLFRFSPADVKAVDRHRSCSKRPALALLCNLRC